MLRLDHVALRVSDMDAAITFYTQKLGLRLLSDQVDEEHHERFAFLELDGGNLELLQVLDEDNAPAPYRPPEPDASLCPHLAIATADLASETMRLQKRGVPIFKGPLEIGGQVRWLYTADPDNNVIEFVQWL